MIIHDKPPHKKDARILVSLADPNIDPRQGENADQSWRRCRSNFLLNTLADRREFRRLGLTRAAQVAGGSGARQAVSGHPVAARREVWAEDELALETPRFEAAVCLGDLIEGDPLGDAGLDGARCQQPEEPLQVLPEPGGMPG